MGPEKKLPKNHCKWCGKLTHMEPILTSDTPILEFIEEKINKYGRDRIWGEDSDWSRVNIDPEFEAELLVYDGLLNTVRRKVVCISCLKQDDDLFKKYYGVDEDEDDGYINFEIDFQE